MARTKRFWPAMSVKRFALMGLAALLLFGFSSSELYAQKKKKKGKNHDHQVDLQAEKQHYLRELYKFWSFGYENYKNKQYERAIKHFWKVTKMDTINKFPRVYRYLGDCYLKLEKPDSAQIVFEMGSKKYPEDAHLHRMVGFFLAQREEVDEAIQEYEKVIELEPESVRDMKPLAALYVKADRIDDAIATYNKILEIDPNDVEVQKNLSELLKVTGDVEGVIEAKEKVRAQDPNNSRVRFDLGKLYFDQGEFEKAIELFREYLSLSPNDVTAIEYIATSYQRLEKPRNAIAEYKKILEIQPDNTKIMCGISRAYKDLGNYVTARSYARRALRTNSAYGLGWIALGEVYEASAENCVEKKKGKVEFNDKLVYELAAIQYRKALKDAEFSQEAERHLSYLQAVLPTKEDKFMHKGQKKPVGPCYEWIK